MSKTEWDGSKGRPRALGTPAAAWGPRREREHLVRAVGSGDAKGPKTKAGRSRPEDRSGSEVPGRTHTGLQSALSPTDRHKEICPKPRRIEVRNQRQREELRVARKKDARRTGGRESSGSAHGDQPASPSALQAQRPDKPELGQGRGTPGPSDAAHGSLEMSPCLRGPVWQFLVRDPVL